MKKFLMAIFTLAVATTVASAAVGINWTAGQWGEANTTDYPAGTAILDNNSVLWQLIYAGANDNIDAIPNGSIPGATDAYGDDQVWAYRTITQGGGTADGTDWDNWLMPSGNATLFTSSFGDVDPTTISYVYQRVFESSTPSDGTWYYESGLTVVIETYSASDPTSITKSYADENAAFVPDQQLHAVPEPATMSLLGLGALVMAIRRRRS